MKLKQLSINNFIIFRTISPYCFWYKRLKLKIDFAVKNQHSTETILIKKTEMSEGKYFIVLRECRTLLKILNFSNKHGLYFDAYESSPWIFYPIFSLPLIVMFSTNLWFCFDYNFDLEKVIWALNLIAAVVQGLLIFFCMLAKKNLLIDMMDNLQWLINQSMIFIEF